MYQVKLHQSLTEMREDPWLISYNLFPFLIKKSYLVELVLNSTQAYAMQHASESIDQPSKLLQ